MDYNKLKEELNNRGIYDIKAIFTKSFQKDDKFVTIICLLVFDKYVSFQINKDVNELTDKDYERFVKNTVRQLEIPIFENVDYDKLFDQQY